MAVNANTLMHEINLEILTRYYFLMQINHMTMSDPNFFL